MITSPLCGTRTENLRNTVFRRPDGMPYWLLMRFHTPFFYVNGGDTLYGRAGQLLLHPSYTPIVHGGVDGGFCNDWIYFDGEGVAELCAELDIPVNKAFDVSLELGFENALETIMREQKKCDLGHLQKISAIISSLLVDVGRACRRETVGEKHRSTAEDAIYRTHIAVAESCARQWTLSEMAELSGYSVSRFCGLYKKQYGISPTEHLIKHRIARAKHLLLSGLYNVSETAEMCGFSSLHYFSLTFKKHVGCSPTVFMRLGENGTEEGADGSSI